MKIFEIIDEESSTYIGCLICYEKSEDYAVELVDDIDEWTAPLLFDKYVREREYTIPRKASRLWVEERVIPSDRQNIAFILKNSKIKSYNVIKLLELSKGKCSQDNMYMKAIDDLPDYVKDREKHFVKECVALSANRLLCFFNDSTTRISHLSEYAYVNKIDTVMRNEKVYKSCSVAAGGRCITFNNSIDIPYHILYESGDRLGITLDDFLTFTRQNILDTTKSCEVLDCSRQNVAYLVQTDKLNPVKEEVRGGLYLKADVLKNSW